MGYVFYGLYLALSVHVSVYHEFSRERERRAARYFGNAAVRILGILTALA
jgi:hypothetical protein